MICISPIATRSVTARSDLPMSRWISWVRPDWRPFAASRPMRSADEPGSSEYSAVTHPFPPPRSQGGTRSSTEAVQSTFVRPVVTSTEPAAKTVKSRSKVAGRRSSGVRPSARRVRGSPEVTEVAGELCDPLIPCTRGRRRPAGSDARMSTRASSATASALITGDRWVIRRRPTSASRAVVTCLTPAHVPCRPFVFLRVSGLAQGKVDPWTELCERPAGSGVGRVAEHPACALDPYGESLRPMVGAREAQR